MKEFLQTEMGAWLNFIAILIAIFGMVFSANRYLKISRKISDRFRKSKSNISVKKAEKLGGYFQDRREWIAQKNGIETYCAYVIISAISDILLISINIALSLYATFALILAYVNETSAIHIGVIFIGYFLISFIVDDLKETIKRRLLSTSSYERDETDMLLLIQEQLRKSNLSFRQQETLIHDLLKRRFDL